MTSSIKLGSMPNKDRGFRDMVHVPLIVCECTGPVMPGMKVRFIDPVRCIVETTIDSPQESEVSHGIVDPTLPDKPIPAGRTFNVLLYPEVTHDQRHTFDLGIGESGEVAVEIEMDSATSVKAFAEAMLKAKVAAMTVNKAAASLAPVIEQDAKAQDPEPEMPDDMPDDPYCHNC